MFMLLLGWGRNTWNSLKGQMLSEKQMFVWSEPLNIVSRLCDQTVGEPASAGRCVRCPSGAAAAGGAGSGREWSVKDGVWCPAGATERQRDKTQRGECQRRTSAGRHDLPETTGRRPHEQPQRTQVQVPERSSHTWSSHCYRAGAGTWMQHCVCVFLSELEKRSCRRSCRLLRSQKSLWTGKTHLMSSLTEPSQSLSICTVFLLLVTVTVPYFSFITV